MRKRFRIQGAAAVVAVPQGSDRGMMLCVYRYTMSGRGIGGKGLGTHPRPAKRTRQYKTPRRPNKARKVEDPADVPGSEYELAWEDIDLETQRQKMYGYEADHK